MMMKYKGLPVPDWKNPTAVIKDLPLEQAVAEYESSASRISDFKYDLKYEDHQKWAQTNMTTLLTCNQINTFLSRVWTPNYDSSPEFCYLGFALSALMKKAYENGTTSFHIILPDQANLPYFGVYLQGSKERPYIIDVTGNLGEKSFYRSLYINSIIRGNAICPASESAFLQLDFHGEVTGTVGYDVKNSHFRFRKAPSPPIRFIDKAIDSVFQVRDETAFRSSHLLFFSMGSKIELLGKNGKVRRTRMYKFESQPFE